MKETKENYVLKIRKCNQLYINRIRFEKEKLPNNYNFWKEEIIRLVSLSLVISKRIDKLLLEELREFQSLFTVADIVHDIAQPQEQRERSKTALRNLIDQSIPRYAYLLDMTEEELESEMAKEKNTLMQSQTAIVERDGGLITDRPLNFRQNQEEIKDQKETAKIIPFESIPAMLEETEYARRRIEKESKLKRHLADLLKKSYENIKDFEKKYKHYSNSHNKPTEIQKTSNLILKYQKIQSFKEHMDKVGNYHQTISRRYNRLYNLLTKQLDELNQEEYIKIENLFLMYEKLTLSLKNTIGNMTIDLMHQRLAELQVEIIRYNTYIEQISYEDKSPVNKNNVNHI